MDRFHFFEEQAKWWDDVIGSVEDEKISMLFENMSIFKGDKIVDIGAGTGLLIPYLSKAVGSNGAVYALDFSPAMLREAKNKFGHLRNVGFICADVMEMPLPCLVNMAICNGCFPHFLDKIGALRAIFDALLPGGALVISHLSNKDEINQKHLEIGGEIAKDLIPNLSELEAMLRRVNFEPVVMFDEDVYFAKAAKS
ncbi:MAG TPA: class I SAM-dependent methyltransferase [Actinobacteria bacterium]|nr:class I SAM-dependent methyltransferase [Actinomycetota bacterium]